MKRIAPLRAAPRRISIWSWNPLLAPKFFLALEQRATACLPRSPLPGDQQRRLKNSTTNCSSWSPSFL